MYCCEKKCIIVSIRLMIIVFVWNVRLMVIVSSSNPAHIDSFNFASENLQAGGHITFDTHLE